MHVSCSASVALRPARPSFARPSRASPLSALEPRKLALSCARLVFAAWGVVAMTYQFANLNATLPSFSPGNFFSFFTIQTNILAVAMLALAAVVPRRERTRLFDAVRGAITLYISITGVVFALLLSGLQEELDTHIAWVDFTVHKLIPIVLVIDWLIDPPRHRFPFRLAFAWLSYPLVWFAYTLIRGASEDWYPYPFVDVLRHGYGRVILNGAILIICFAGAAVLYVWIGNWRASRASAEATEPSSVPAA